MTGKRSTDLDEYKIKGWHLKKEVTIGQILTLVTVAITALIWAIQLESKVDKLNAYVIAEDKRIEQKHDIYLKNLNDRFNLHQETLNRILNDINQGITRLNDKLDTKADK